MLDKDIETIDKLIIGIEKVKDINTLDDIDRRIRALWGIGTEYSTMLARFLNRLQVAENMTRKKRKTINFEDVRGKL